jgi:ketosteroid isomerase-like protein
VGDTEKVLSRLAKSLGGAVNGLEAGLEALIKLPDVMAIENLLKSMVWAMDAGDGERWSSVFSDDIVYRVPQHGIEIAGIKALREFAEKIVFVIEERRFSAITNIMIDVEGDTATGRDYFTHFGYPIDMETGKASTERAMSLGQHFYEFSKQDGVWRITKFDVHVSSLQEPGQ